MYAVIECGGKQHKVKKGDILKVELLSDKVGANKDFSDVLLIGEGAEVKVGQPLVSGAKVSSEVVAHERGPKIIVYHKKRRKQYERKLGHRQPYTRLLITGLDSGSAKENLDKKERDEILGRVGFAKMDAFDEEAVKAHLAKKNAKPKKAKAEVKAKAEAPAAKKKATKKTAKAAKKKTAKKTTAKKKTAKKTTKK